jgi:hypothetical protein
MGIDAALGRIQQILSFEQQLLNPTAPSAASTASAPTGGASTSATPAGGSFASALATAQTTPTGGAALNASGYVNPLANASVRPERVDQGVDYAGSGTLGAIGPGVVTQVVQSGSGWEGGGYVEYKLTAGPYAGKSIYYAEGVTPTVTVGETLAPGQPVATIIPGAPHGVELGFASGRGDQTSYATAYGGGYSEGALTAAGLAFSNLVASLGGPAGLTEGRPVTGTFQ